MRRGVRRGGELVVRDGARDAGGMDRLLRRGRRSDVVEYGEWRLKRYDEARDEWWMEASGGVPRGAAPARRGRRGWGGRRREAEQQRIYTVGGMVSVAFTLYP